MRAITGWWLRLNQSGSATLSNLKSRQDWQEIVREPSPRNEGQQKVRVLVKPAQSPDGSQSVALCWSQGRTEKDRAIRQKQEIRFLADMQKLRKRIATAQLRKPAKIYEAIGRLKERYPRVARYYELAYDEQKSRVLLAGARRSANKEPKRSMAVTCSRAAAPS